MSINKISAACFLRQQAQRMRNSDVSSVLIDEVNGDDEVSTGSVATGLFSMATSDVAQIETRSLPLPVLTSWLNAIRNRAVRDFTSSRQICPKSIHTLKAVDSRYNISLEN